MQAHSVRAAVKAETPLGILALGATLVVVALPSAKPLARAGVIAAVCE